MYNVKKAAEAQTKLQQEKGYPEFAPTNGICWSCKQNIYMPIIKTIGEDSFVTGNTVKDATEKLITGCPHCHKSYCD